RSAGLRRQIPAPARSARGADQARPCLDREDGRASLGSVPGAVAGSATASAAVARTRRDGESGYLRFPAPASRPVMQARHAPRVVDAGAQPYSTRRNERAPRSGALRTPSPEQIDEKAGLGDHGAVPGIA